MNSKLLTLLVTLLTPFLLHAQTPNQSYNNGFKCGITKEAAAIIKQRMLDNRNSFTKQEVQNLITGRTTTYIPLSIHNVAGDANGLGKTSEALIMAFICGLNDIYAAQDVQFFIHNVIYNRVNTFIYNNAGSGQARNSMMSYRVPNTLNLIIGASTNNPTASWYDVQGDFVFLLQQMLTPEAKTEAHEIGHFFTLPHTFFGWEGNDVRTLLPNGGNVNCSYGSGWFAHVPERVPRTGSRANCQTAGDGFCDTEADYFSSRINCPYPNNINDCDGNPLDVDESNIMSYAFDACVTGFSTEQETAIAMNIASRSWVTNTPPTTAAVTGSPTVVSPADGGQLGDINSSTVRLEWTPVTGANWYYLEVVGTKFPGLWLPDNTNIIYRGLLYSGLTHFDLPTNNLVAGSRYAWRVKAANSLSTCAPLSTYSKFEAVASITTNIEDLPIERQMTFTVSNNPVSTSSIPFNIHAATDVVASIRLYSMDGREVLSFTKQDIGAGDTVVQLPAEGLANGLYVAVLSTATGQLQQKVVIQR